MGQVGSTGGKDGLGILITGIRMGNGHGAELGRFFRKFHGTGQLCCYIGNPYQSLGSFIELSERVKIGAFQIGTVLGTLFLFTEEGTFHLDTHQPGVSGGRVFMESGGCPKSGVQHIIGQCHGSRGKGGDTAACQILGHGFDTCIVSVREVGTGVAVIMHIYQSGNYIGTLQINSVLIGNDGQDFGKLSVLRSEGTVLKSAVNKYIGIFE